MQQKLIQKARLRRPNRRVRAK